MIHTLIRRDQDKGYYGRQLWLPKRHVNTASVKAGLEFPVVEEEGINFLQLWRETEEHVIVPREYVPKDQYHLLDFPIIDTRPKKWPKVRFVDHIVLDKIKPEDDTQTKAYAALIKHGSGIMNLTCGKGKGQPLNEIVYTPTGARTLAKISIGDQVLGSDGKATTVIGVFPQGVRNVYEISFSDSTSVRCDDDHLWYVRYNRQEWKVVPTKIIRKQLRNAAGCMYAIPYCRPAEFVAGKELLIDPWLLGAMLGDGSSRSTPHLHNPEPDIQQKFCERLPGTDTGEVVHTKNRCDHVRVRGGTLTKYLRHYDIMGKRSYEKHIPQDYLLASVNDRWELLRGLVDTDGFVAGRQIDYSTSSPQLAKDIVQLVRSLGGKAHVALRKTQYTYKGEKLTGRTSHRLHIHFPAGGATPVSSKKQMDKWDRSIGQREYKYITGVRFIGKEPTVCIKVDAEDQCYLTRDFIVTHNTILALKYMAYRSVPAIVIVNNTTLINQWTDRINEFLEVEGGVGIAQGPPSTWDWEGRGIVLAMIHSLALRYEELPAGFDRYFGGVYWDECHHLSASIFSRTAPLFFGDRYGLTATVTREDGLEPIYQYHIGSVFHRDLAQELKPRIYFQAMPVQINQNDPAVRQYIFDRGGKMNIPLLRTYLGRMEENNRFIAGKLAEPLAHGRKVLALSHSKDQLKMLNRMFPESGLCTGDEDPADRLITLRNCQLTFGTLQLVKEALDEQTLDTLFFLSPFGSNAVDMGGKNTLQQGMGRILRYQKNKKTPVVVIMDYVNIPKFHRMCRKMKQLLHNWPIDEGGPFEYQLLRPYANQEIV